MLFVLLHIIIFKRITNIAVLVLYLKNDTSVLLPEFTKTKMTFFFWYFRLVYVSGFKTLYPVSRYIHFLLQTFLCKTTGE